MLATLVALWTQRAEDAASSGKENSGRSSKRTDLCTGREGKGTRDEPGASDQGFGDRRKNQLTGTAGGMAVSGRRGCSSRTRTSRNGPVTRRDCPTIGGIAKGGGSARCRSTGTLPDTGMRFSFRRGRRKADTHETSGESSTSFIFGQELEDPKRPHAHRDGRGSGRGG